MKSKTSHASLPPLEVRSERTGNFSPVQSPFAPVLVWIVLQLIPLGMSAARIPFYAIKSFPQPAELLALPFMLTVQIGASALLFPFLLRDLRAAGLVIVASWPFAVLAVFLSGLPPLQTAPRMMVCVTVWLIGLGIWRSVLRANRRQSLAIAIATFVALGNPLLQYLAGEYGSEGFSAVLRNWGPIQQSLALSRFDGTPEHHWRLAIGYLGIAALARICRRIVILASRRGTSAHFRHF